MAQINWNEDINKFFNNDLKVIFRNIFKFPTTAWERIKNEAVVKSAASPVCAWVLTYLIVLLANVLFLGTKSVGWGSATMLSVAGFGYFLKMSLMPLFFVLFLTILSIVFMAVKGKADVEGAFYHSGIHAVNFSLVWLLGHLMVLIFSNGNPGVFGAIIIILCLVVYPLSMGITLMRQYLHSAEAEDSNSFSWWSSPVVVAGSLGLAIWIMSEMGSALNLGKMF